MAILTCADRDPIRSPTCGPRFEPPPAWEILAVPRVVTSCSQIKHIGCQTDVRDSFGPQRISGAVSNHHQRRRPESPQNQIYVVPQNQAKTMNANTEPKTAPKVINGPHQRQVRARGFWKPWRLAGGYAQSVQQALSARSGGGLAAAWARGVQASAAGVAGGVFEGLRNAGAAGDEVGAFRRGQSHVRRAARAHIRDPRGAYCQARCGGKCQGD